MLVRKIGGGGRFVPLIGDTQPLSWISCCSTVRYEVKMQNSSNDTEMVSSDCLALAAEDGWSPVDGAADALSRIASRWLSIMLFRLSMDSRFWA